MRSSVSDKIMSHTRNQSDVEDKPLAFDDFMKNIRNAKKKPKCTTLGSNSEYGDIDELPDIMARSAHFKTVPMKSVTHIHKFKPLEDEEEDQQNYQ